jgi:autotransporter-associated beta strand protein
MPKARIYSPPRSAMQSGQAGLGQWLLGGFNTYSGTTTVSAGTLTNTVTAVVNGNGVDFKLNAVSSLTQTTLYAYVSARMDGTGVYTVQ